MDENRITISSECGVTASLGDGSFQFVKFSHSQSRLLPANASKASIVRAEQQIYEVCEAVVERRLKKLTRMIRQIEEE